MTLEDAIQYAKQLDGCADILMVKIADGSASHATTWNSEKGKPFAIRYAEAIKKSGAKIVIAPNGGFQNPDLNEEYIASGKADIIAMARAFICDWDYGKKICAGRGEDVVPCIRCNKCHGESMMDGPWYTACSVNPKIGISTAVRSIGAPGAPKKVAIIGGGGEIGADAGMHLAKAGHNATMLTSEKRLFPDNRPHYPITIVEIYQDLKNFSIITKAKATGISAGKITYVDGKGNEQSIRADDVVLYAGFKPKKGEALQFYGSAKQFFTIGDCSEIGGNIQKCIRSAFFTASEI